MIAWDALTDEQKTTIEQCLEECLDRSEDHLVWLDSPEAEDEDDLEEQREATTKRVATLKSIGISIE